MWWEGGSHCGGCVCVWCWGLQSLVTLVSWQQAEPTKPTSKREEQTSNSSQEQNQQTKQEAKQQGGQQAPHQNTHRQRSGQRQPKNEQERWGRRRRPATAGPKEKRGPGEAARTGGWAAQAEEKGACRSSGVLRGDLDHPGPSTPPGERKRTRKTTRKHKAKHSTTGWLHLFFVARARCLLAGLRYFRLTRLPRHDRGPAPGGNRSAASCLCTVLRRALYHYATRSPNY